MDTESRSKAALRHLADPLLVADAIACCLAFSLRKPVATGTTGRGR